MKETIPVFGAGALGLGFLGPMLAGDYRLVFCDIGQQQELIERLQAAGSYLVNVCADAVSAEPVLRVGGLNIDRPDDREQAGELLRESRIAFTAVGSRGIDATLEFIGSRVRRNPFVFLCENDHRIRDRWADRLAGKARLCETIMGRMCRLEAAGGDYRPLDPGWNRAVVVEEFGGLPVPADIHRAAELKGPAWQPMSAEEFAARACLKLYAHNGAHAYLAFLGALQGLTLLREAGPELRAGAAALLAEEIIPALLRRYPGVLDAAETARYAAALPGRITRPSFADTVARGTRSSWEKIAGGERLVEAARFVLANGGLPVRCAGIIAAGIRLNRPGELSLSRVDTILTGHCRIQEPELAELVRRALEEPPWASRDRVTPR